MEGTIQQMTEGEIGLALLVRMLPDEKQEKLIKLGNKYGDYSKIPSSEFNEALKIKAVRNDIENYPVNGGIKK